MDHFKVISHGCDLALFFTFLLVAWTFMMQIITVIRVFFFKPNKLAGNPMEMTEVQELNAAAKKLSGM